MIWLARSSIHARATPPGPDKTGTSMLTRLSVPVRFAPMIFIGEHASFDPQPDWVDLNKVAIPQADEQQRLLVNLIEQMNVNKKPLPRFWYFPSGFKAVVIMTGDDHNSGGTSGRFDQYIADSPTGCSVADWACVRSTSYVWTEHTDPELSVVCLSRL